MSTQAPSALSCSDLIVERSGAEIIHSLSIEAPAGEITVLLGANGAGKTTLLEAVSGLIPVKSGTIRLLGADVTQASAERRAQAGLAHVEQGRPVFGGLTVAENLMVSVPKSRLSEAFDIFPELKACEGRRGALLSGGEQQMLVIARAFLRRPKVLLLDEVSLGLAPIIVNRIIPRLRDVASTGIAVVLVEQFARLALQVGDRVYVMAKGVVEFEGSCRELIADEQRLNAAYFRRAESVQPEGS